MRTIGVWLAQAILVLTGNLAMAASLRALTAYSVLHLKRDAEILAGFLAEEVTYRGSVHGLIHNVGVEELWFNLRRAGAGDLVRCEFRENLYQEVIEACERRHAVVHVHGLITARRVDQSVTRVRAERLKVAPALTEERYRMFFGADPNYAGDLSSEDFIERNRYEQ